MTRILADLPEDDVKWLDAQATEQGKSRAQLLRDAVAAYRAEGSKDWIAKGRGYWKDRSDIGDSMAYQRTIRADREPA